MEIEWSFVSQAKKLGNDLSRGFLGAIPDKRKDKSKAVQPLTITCQILQQPRKI